MLTETKRFLQILFSEIQNDRVLEGSAALSYYLTLATFPALIALIALVPYLPIDNLADTIFFTIESNLPGSTGRMLQEIAREALETHRPTLLSTGFLGALWASSSGMGSIINQLNIAYDLKTNRGLVKQRLVAIALTLIYFSSILSASALVVMSEGLSTVLDNWGQSSIMVSYTITVVRYLIAYAILLLGFASLYFLAPNCRPAFKFVTPGSLFGSTLLVVAALCFDYYISNFASYDRTYGSIGGFIVYMLWLYIGSFVLLVGAEINGIYRGFENEAE